MWLVYFLKGIKTGGRGLTLSDNNVGRLLRLISEVVLQYLLRARRVAKLGVEGSARVMGYHAVTCAERVLHGPPRVVLGSGLYVPYITCITVQLSGFYRRSYCICITDSPTSSVNKPSSLLEALEKVCIDKSPRTLV